MTTSRTRMLRWTISGIGQLLLIVTGVFAALAADEWRQNQGERALQATYLRQLAADLEVDTALWADLRPMLQRKIDALDRAGMWIRHPNYSAEAVTQFLADLTTGTRLAYGAATLAERATFDEMIADGRFRLISDSETRYALTRYHVMVETQAVRVVSRQTRYAALVYELVPREQEFVVRSDLSREEQQRIARRAVAMELEGPIIAERNRGQLRMEVAESLLSRARAVLLEVQAAIAAQSFADR